MLIYLAYAGFTTFVTCCGWDWDADLFGCSWLQIRLYSIYIEDAELDYHWQEAGMFWEVHQKYLEVYYNFDFNGNGKNSSSLNITLTIRKEGAFSFAQ